MLVYIAEESIYNERKREREKKRCRFLESTRSEWSRCATAAAAAAAALPLGARGAYRSKSVGFPPPISRPIAQETYYIQQRVYIIEKKIVYLYFFRKLIEVMLESSVVILALALFSTSNSTEQSW